MSTTSLCDAVTESGKNCKNRAAGSAGGRQYCRILSHKSQILAMDVDETATAPDVVEENKVWWDSSASDPETGDESKVQWGEAFEPMEEEASAPSYPDSCHTCPACGEKAARPVAALGGSHIQSGCLACGHTWVE